MGRGRGHLQKGPGASQTGGGGGLAADLLSRHQVEEGNRREGLGESRQHLKRE